MIIGRQTLTPVSYTHLDVYKRQEGINLSDTDPTEHRIDEESLSLVYDGGVLKPLQTRNGISFIQNKYLSPLEDVIDMVQLYERETSFACRLHTPCKGKSFRIPGN